MGERSLYEELSAVLRLSFLNRSCSVKDIVDILYSRCWDDEYGWRGDLDAKKWGLLSMRVGCVIGENLDVHRTASVIAEIAKGFGIE